MLFFGSSLVGSRACRAAAAASVVRARSKRPGTLAVLVVMIVCLAPRLAWAGDWYIRWDCVGECAGYGAGESGIIGPFPNEDECERYRHGPLDIPDDSLFHHFCEHFEDPSQSTPSAPAGAVPYAGATTAGAPQEIELSSIEFGFLAGPGWGASDGSGTTSGQGTVGFDLDIHTGPPYAGATFQLGIQGTRLEAPLIGATPRGWFLAPASVGIALTPRLFGLGERSLWLDLSASVVGFAAFGCRECPAPVFGQQFGYGWVAEGGLDLMLSEETGIGLDLVVPRYGIGTAAPGDLRLTSPRGEVRVSIVGHLSP